MNNTNRPAPFVLISSNHGTMIINRNDYRPSDGCGVGSQIMHKSCYDQNTVNVLLALLRTRYAAHGKGVVALDCGANIGVFTIEWAKMMHEWGHVISYEAQEKVYYALAGNIVINNCLNVTAKHAAVGSKCGKINIPEPNYLIPSSYGSFELKQRENTEFIGQKIDYEANSKSVDMVSIDSLGLERLDFLKIDVEGMEWEVLQGAKKTIKKCKPMMVIEILKSDGRQIAEFLVAQGYNVHRLGQMDFFAIHQSDPSAQRITMDNGNWKFAL